MLFQEWRFMAGFQIGGMLILIAGLLVLAGSLPTMRLIPRSSTISTQVGLGMVNWLMRGFGLILCVLGLVTLLQV
jgi:hypothetical protein